MTVAKVDVGGLSRTEAIRRVRQRYGPPAMRAVRVSSAAAATGWAPPAPASRWTSAAPSTGRSPPAAATTSHARLALAEQRQHPGRRAGRDHRRPRPGGRFVTRLGDAVARPAVDATLQVAVVRVSVTHSHAGRRLDAPAALTVRIVRSLRDAYARRTLAAATAPVAPALTKAGVWRAHRMTVTVSQHQKVVRVFRRGHLVKRYRVAVGSKQYPTPYGDLQRAEHAAQPAVERPAVRVGGRPGRPDDPRRRAGQPARRPLDRLRRLGRLPRHARGALDRARRLARLRPHAPERRDRPLQAGRASARRCSSASSRSKDSPAAVAHLV